MFIELHILQNFAPANLNRDDTGMPKDCTFGGYRRARISSQCFKRAVRVQFKDEKLLEPQFLAVRTKRVVGELARRLADRGRDDNESRVVAKFTIGGVNLEAGDDDTTQYLLFLSNQEIGSLANLCDEHWDQLSAAAEAMAADHSSSRSRPTKASRKKAVPGEVRKAVEKIFATGGQAVDLALFGRMLTDLPERNVPAASQVAHAISTNRMGMELDYYTAVDDLQPEDTTGAGMLGTVGFNSACFYRYSNVDFGQLTKNLQDDRELAVAGLKAFITASINAIPTGKQNSMAAHNPPSFVLAVIREAQLWNLANAFLKPVYPQGHEDLAMRSVRELDTYWGKLSKMYGENGILGKWAVSLDGNAIACLKDNMVDDVGTLTQSVLDLADGVCS